MTSKTKQKSSVKKPANRQFKRHGGNPNPPTPPIEHRFKPGQSGNPSGRPKLLGESYKEWLSKVNAQGITNAEAVAMAMGLEALRGDVGAAREIRAATEGEMHVLQDAWKQEVIDLLKSGSLTPENVIEAIGLDDARSIFIAAGIAFVPGASERQGAAGADSTGA